MSLLGNLRSLKLLLKIRGAFTKAMKEGKPVIPDKPAKNSLTIIGLCITAAAAIWTQTGEVISHGDPINWADALVNCAKIVGGLVAGIGARGIFGRIFLAIQPK